MDMSTGNADTSVADLPLNDLRCVKAEAYTAFYAAENASQAAVPRATQFYYGHDWVIIVGIVCTLPLLPSHL
ncbi:hypothetical protein V1527DRAFT_467100 [Lipomyces starkeyi]